ncbi:MAG: type II secretion system F family protein [Nitrososphaerota archaeon]
MAVRTIYWAIAAALAVSWVVSMQVLFGRTGFDTLLPAVIIFAASGVGSALSGRLAERLIGYATQLVERAQAKRIPIDVAEETAQHIAMGGALAAAFTAAAASVLLSMGPGLHLLIISLAAMPIAPATAYLLGWGNRVSERRERTDWELPFFTVYSTILAHCGLTLYASMRLLAKTGRRLFQQMVSEAEDVERLAELTGRGVVESLEVHAANHPHEGFQSLIYSTTSVWRMGGSMVSALEDRAAEFLKALEERYDRYATLVAAVMEAFIILLLLLPMGLVLTAVTSPGQSGAIITVMTIGVIPTMGLLMYFFVRSKSPRHLDDIKPGPIDIAFAAGMAAATIPPLILLRAPQTIMLSVPTIAFCIGFYIRMRPQIIELKECDVETRRWLKDVTEFRRLGNPPATAIFKTVGHRYKPAFKKVLESIVGRMSMGLTIWEAGAGVARSWLMRMSLYLLHSINLSGGGSPFLMDKLVELLRSYNLAREKSAGRLSPFKFLAISMPLITALTIGMVLPIANLGGLLQTSEAGQAIAGGAGGLPLASVTPEEMLAMADAGMVMIAIGSLFYMLIINRAVDGHPYNTWRIAAVMSVAVASYYMMAPVGDLMMSLLRFGR